MARLEDLQKSLSEMTKDEVMEKIRHVREDRRINKYAITARVASKRKKVSKTSKALKDLTPGQIAELMKEFEDEG